MPCSRTPSAPICDCAIRGGERDRIEFAEVARWFEARTGAVPFSFEYVCEVLEINPAPFRKPNAHTATPTCCRRSSCALSDGASAFAVFATRRDVPRGKPRWKNRALRARCIADCERLSRSASVVESRIRAVASRTSHISSRTAQVRSSWHSSHFRYAVLLAHGSGASGPSIARNTCPAGDHCGRLREEVTAAASLAAVQKAMILQLQQNEFQEAARNVFARCNIRDQDRTFAVFFGEHDQRLERVLRLLGNHLAFCAPGSFAPIIRYLNLADNISPVMPLFSKFTSH